MTTSTAHPTLDDVERRLRRPADPGVFGDDELTGLPEPVTRYFRAAITPGAPLARSADLDMRGELKLNERWLRLRAHEVLTPHDGLMWRARVAGVISGSDHCLDDHGAMDWKLFGLIPVVHADGPDVARSSAGRAAGEAVWVPTSLLPRFGVQWEASSDHDLTARFPIAQQDVTLDLRIDDAGVVEWARLDRWGDPDESGEFGFHPFGFQTTETRAVGPFRIPAVGSAGWFHGSDRWDEGEFFRCTITDLVPTIATETDR